MSEVAVTTMSEHDARRLTERIRIAAVNYSEAKDKLMSLVRQAKEDAAHLTLGYASWTAYLADVMGEEPLRLARGERREVVQMLSNEGVSRDAIAAITGVAEKTIQRDMQGGTFVPPSKVTGMDGKTYTRPEPKPEPEPDVAKDLAIINDIRLYLNAIASSRQIAGLTPKGKQHIIDAANNLITQLQKDQ